MDIFNCSCSRMVNVDLESLAAMKIKIFFFYIYDYVARGSFLLETPP